MTFNKTIITAVSTIVISCLSLPAVAKPVTYEADPTHTFANFSYEHLGLSRQNNSFNDGKATLVLDLEEKVGQLEVEIDLQSVNTGAKVFNEHIQGKDFFDTKNHPIARFESTEIVFDGDTPVAVNGTLTIKGISQPVTFEIDHFVLTKHPMLQKPAIGANAKAQVKRSSFNMDKYVPAISDEVTITVSFEGIAAGE